MRNLTLLACAALAATAQAQFNVLLPQSAVGVAGSNANNFPWGLGTSTWPGLRIQCIYDSSHFTSASITAPILITHVRWRANDAAATTTWTGGTYNQATLALGTAPADYTAATTNYAANTGPDYQVVYSGPVAVQPGAGAGVGVPGPMIVDITLTTPFYYDPSLGDLIVDTDYLYPGNWSGGSQTPLDVQNTNVLASRVYASAAYPTANGIDNNAPVIELEYAPAAGGTVLATATSTGAGCISASASLYENFAAAASFDLANSSFSMLPSGTGYTVIPGLSSFVAPSPTAALIAVGDDVEQTVTLTGSFAYPGGSTTALTVCSNGFVSVATGNGTGYTPAAATALGYPQTSWGDWHDYYALGGTSGNVKFEQIGSVAYVTWDAVVDFGTTTPNTWQLQFDTATGIVTCVFGAMSLGGNGHLVYYSPGGASSDPGSTDLSTAVPLTITLAGSDIVPLALGSTSRPIIGTNWNLNVTNVPATGVIGVNVFGLADPGINDLAFLGAPTCGLRASLDLLSAWVVSGSSHAHSLALPNSVGLLNLHVYATAAVFQVPPVNAFGAITSNGVDGKVGDY